MLVVLLLILLLLLLLCLLSSDERAVDVPSERVVIGQAARCGRSKLMILVVGLIGCRIVLLLGLWHRRCLGKSQAVLVKSLLRFEIKGSCDRCVQVLLHKVISIRVRNDKVSLLIARVVVQATATTAQLAHARIVDLVQIHFII